MKRLFIDSMLWLAIAMMFIAIAYTCTAKAETMSSAIEISSDQPIAVKLSNRDINRVVCEGGTVENFKFSAEKGAQVEADGGDAYIKFLVGEQATPSGPPKRLYAKQRSEFFIKCRGKVYTVFGEPSNIPAQTVILAGGSDLKSDINQEALKPLSNEERAIKITQSVLRDNVPDTYNVSLSSSGYTDNSISGANVRLAKTVGVEGLGLVARVFHIRASQSIILDERSFLSPQFGRSIYAVTIETPSLKRGEVGRAVVISRQSQSGF